MGQFSWMTQDTGQQIGSEPSNTITVHMYDNKGNRYSEGHYEGYGVFGGKDYHALIAEMNNVEGLTGDPDIDREFGIDLECGDKANRPETLYPALVTSENYDIRKHDFTRCPESDPNQSWPMEHAGYSDDEESW